MQVHRGGAAREKMDAIFKHPEYALVSLRNNAIYHKERNPRWTGEGPGPLLEHKYGGLLERLDKVIGGAYDFKSTARTTIYKERRRNRSDGDPPRESKDPYSKLSGERLGAVVHDQLLVYHRSSISLAECLRSVHVHRYTRAVLLGMIRKDHSLRTPWTILACEVPVFDSTLGIGTSVDMMCENADGGLVLVEVKTEYEDYFDLGNRQIKLEGVVCTDASDLPLMDSPMNRAMFQALLGKTMIQNTYGTHVNHVAIIHVVSGKVHLKPLPRDILKLENVLYSAAASAAATA